MNILYKNNSKINKIFINYSYDGRIGIENNIRTQSCSNYEKDDGEPILGNETIYQVDSFNYQGSVRREGRGHGEELKVE